MSLPGSPATGRRAARQSERGLLVLLGLIVSAGTVALIILYPALPTLQAEFGASRGMTQLAVSLAALSLAPAALAYGPLADRFGRRRPLLAALVLLELGSLTCAFAPNIETLLAGRCLQGLGAAGCLTLARVVLRDMVGRKRLPKMMAVLTITMIDRPPGNAGFERMADANHRLAEPVPVSRGAFSGVAGVIRASKGNRATENTRAWWRICPVAGQSKIPSLRHNDRPGGRWIPLFCRRRTVRCRNNDGAQRRHLWLVDDGNERRVYAGRRIFDVARPQDRHEWLDASRDRGNHAVRRADADVVMAMGVEA